MTIWRMRITRWIIKATITLPFQRNNGYANAPQRYVIRKFPVFFVRICPYLRKIISKTDIPNCGCNYGCII